MVILYKFERSLRSSAWQVCFTMRMLVAHLCGLNPAHMTTHVNWRLHVDNCSPNLVCSRQPALHQRRVRVDCFAGRVKSRTVETFVRLFIYGLFNDARTPTASDRRIQLNSVYEQPYA